MMTSALSRDRLRPNRLRRDRRCVESAQPFRRPTRSGSVGSRPSAKALAVSLAAAAGLILDATSCTVASSPAPRSSPTSAADQRPVLLTVPGQPAWQKVEVDSTNPDAVLVAAATALYSYAPAVDDSAAQAFDRARPLLSESYQHNVGDSVTGLARYTGATWHQWHEQNAVITATTAIAADDHPSDTPTSHARVLTITQTVHTAPPDDTGSTDSASPTPITVYAVAGRTGSTARWQITKLVVR